MPGVPGAFAKVALVAVPQMGQPPGC